MVERALADLATRGAITQEYGAKLLASVSDKYDSRPDMAECHKLLGSGIGELDFQDEAAQQVRAPAREHADRHRGRAVARGADAPFSTDA